MKLLTWNTQWCCGLDGRVSPARIIQEACALAEFDVLCLQEIAVHYPGLPGGAAHDQVEIIRSLLPDHQVFFGAGVCEWRADGAQQFGNLVATRLPVQQVEHHRLPYPADAGMRSMPRACSVVTVLDPALGPVRVMTTHLEYHSARQRLAQATALRALHHQACEHARHPPLAANDGSPFQTKSHTTHAVLCGDFNFSAKQVEYEVMRDPAHPDPLSDAWTLWQGSTPQPPTFRVFDKTYGTDPVTFDFVWVSQSLRSRVKSMGVDIHSQASDHQPVWVELG